MLHEQAITIDGHQLVALHLQPEAQGQMLVLLHGVMHSPRYWLADPAFAQRGPALALTLPGHYPAAFPPGFRPEMLTTELIVAVLRQAVMQLLGAQPVTLVGYSTGGFAALALAAALGAQVRRVICIAGFARGQWSGLFGRMQQRARGNALQRLVFTSFFRLGQLHPALFRLGWRAHFADPRGLRYSPVLTETIQVLYPHYRHMDLAAMRAYFAAMPAQDCTAALSQIHVPTLVLAGASDPTVPPAQARWIALHLPNATLALVEGAGHALFAERPTEYRQLLVDWLDHTAAQGLADAP